MKYLDKETVEQAMREIGNGQYFSVVFHKLTDDSVRALQGQLGIRKFVKGGTKTTNDEELQTVYEPANSSYRCFPLDRVLGLRYNGKEVGVLQ